MQAVKVVEPSRLHVTELGEADEHPEPHAKLQERPAT